MKLITWWWVIWWKLWKKHDKYVKTKRKASWYQNSFFRKVLEKALSKRTFFLLKLILKSLNILLAHTSKKKTCVSYCVIKLSCNPFYFFFFLIFSYFRRIYSISIWNTTSIFFFPLLFFLSISIFSSRSFFLCVK